MFVIDFIYSWEISSAVLPHFSMRKKGNTLSTQEQGSRQASITAVVFFPRKQRRQAKMTTSAHAAFDG